MARYLMILGVGDEELDVDGYFRVEFDTSLPDPKWFGFFNGTDRAWGIDWIKILSGDEYEKPLFETRPGQDLIEPNCGLELNYSQIKELLNVSDSD